MPLRCKAQHVNFLQDRRFSRCKNGFMREDGHREEVPKAAGSPSRSTVGDDAHFFTSGRVAGGERVDCLTATFRTHRYAMHAHETFVIGAITSGCGTLLLQGTRHRAGPGDLTLFNPEDLHDGAPHDAKGYSYRVTYPSASLVRSLTAEITGHETRPHFQCRVVKDPAAASRLVAAHQALEAYGWSLATEEALLLAYACCLERHAKGFSPEVPRGREQRRVARIKSLLNERATSSDLSLADIADAVGVSRYHLIRMFHSEVGTTPHAYLVGRRIEAAKHRLRQGEAPVRVAATTGFADQAHLTRVFKARVGVTPGAYRDGVSK
jgi:AraC-like DNA-binding protein